MSHEIMTTDGLVYSGETPWHGIGIRVGDDVFTSKEAIRLCPAATARIEKREVFIRDNQGQFIEVPDYRAITRAFDSRVYSVQGKGFGIVQGDDAFAFCDSLAAEGLVKYEVVGTLRDGARMFLLAKFGQSEVIPNDFVDNYLLFWNTHDGSGAVRALPTSVRVVCANTARMALDSGSGSGVYVRHTTNVLARLDAARESLGFAKRLADENVQVGRALARIQMTKSRWAQLLEDIIPTNPDAKSTTRTDNIRSTILQVAEEGRGVDLPGVQGTGWGALNAVVEFSNYFRSTRATDDVARQANRFESSLFGSSADLIADTKAALLKMAA